MAEAASSSGQPAVIVIPAHNEATVLRRCISTVLADADPGEFDIVVVSNGSTDGTADVAREIAAGSEHRIDVLEVAAASKIAALRAADEYLQREPDATRVYLDADVLLATAAARALVEAVRTSRPTLSLARIDVDYSASSWVVREYYEAWTATGYIARQGAGSGVFALNGAGAMRVSPWPDVINDDGYVARCFGPDERVVCDVAFRSYAARSTWALVRRRARIVNGNRQLAALFSGRPADQTHAETPGVLGELVVAVRNRRVSYQAAAVFVTVTVAARVLAAWRRLRGLAGQWSMDTTTRGVNA